MAHPRSEEALSMWLSSAESSGNRSRHSPEIPDECKRAGFLPAVVCGAVITCAGCEREHQQAAPPAPPEVEFVVAQTTDVPITNEWIGTTDGSVNADIRARVSGYLQTQAYTDGATVKAGDLLFQIDPRPFDAALAQAKAQLAKALADKQKSQLDVERLTPLAAQKAVAQQELDDAIAANAANQAVIEAANAAIEQAQLNLGFTHVTAPIGGIVGIAQAQVGDLVGPTSGTLTTISTLDPIKVIFPIREQDYLRARQKGEEEAAKPLEQREALFRLLLVDGSEFPNKGKFYSIDRQVGVETGTIKIVGIFPNPGNVLRPGQYAKVQAVVRVDKGVVLVPQRAVNELQGVYQVVVVGIDNHASMRRVKVGDRLGSDWIILEGVKAGERVVVEGLQKVRDGAPVKPKPYEQPATASAPASAPHRP